MFSYDLFEKYRESKSWKKNEAAAALGFVPQFVTQLKNGKRHLPTEIAMQIAEELGLNREEVFLKLQAEKSKTAEELDIWSRIIKKIGSGNALGIGAAVALASPSIREIFNCAYCILC